MTPPTLSRPARWRIASLLLVHLLIAAHLIHWRLAGRTLSSIQLSEAGRFAAEGVATAAFFLFFLVVVGTAVFGRFFCAWGCHMLAFQEACRLLLQRLGIRPKPLRFRFVWLIPAAASFHIFVQPLLERWWFGQSLARFDVQLASDDVWANLPGPVIALFILGGGAAMVYFLGSLSFCKYVCPYAPLLSLADRLAFGRIRLVGECDGCARCTAACTTGVRVHEEMALNAVVTNHDCMRCFECVSACPRQVLAYRLGRPTLAQRRVVPSVTYAMSKSEELLLMLVFVPGFVAFNGLYGSVPLLLAAAVGLLVGYAAVMLTRLWRRPFVALRRSILKNNGVIGHRGRIFVVACAAVFALVGHSLFIQYHEWCAARALSDLDFPAAPRALSASDGVRAEAAVEHLRLAQRFGLVDTFDQNMQLAWLHRRLAQPRDVEIDLRRAIALSPRQPTAHFNLGKELLRQGREAEATLAFAEAVRRQPSLIDFVPARVR